MSRLGERDALLRGRRDGWSVRQPEPRVPSRSDVIALALVDQEATDVGLEYARLTEDIGADIPGCGLRIERPLADLTDMVNPCVLRPTVASMLATLRLRKCPKQAAIHSTCCSMHTIMDAVYRVVKALTT